MNNQQNAVFFEIQQISENSPLFNEFKNQEIFFSYFLVDQKYYLFFYEQKSIDIDRIDPFIHILEKLDTKERKIGSLRGFFLYALEIMDNRKDLEILNTNLQASFWRKLRKILRQNKKEVLLRFLFVSPDERVPSYEGSNPILEETIQKLQKSNDELCSQVNFLVEQVERLQQRIINLETQLMNPEHALRRQNIATDATKLTQQDDYTLESEQGPYSLVNLSKVNSALREVREVEKVDSDMERHVFPESSKMPLKTLSERQQYDNTPIKNKLKMRLILKL
jgi:hypothetical protein